MRDPKHPQDVAIFSRYKMLLEGISMGHNEGCGVGEPDAVCTKVGGQSRGQRNGCTSAAADLCGIVQGGAKFSRTAGARCDGVLVLSHAPAAQTPAHSSKAGPSHAHACLQSACKQEDTRAGACDSRMTPTCMLHHKRALSWCSYLPWWQRGDHGEQVAATRWRHCCH